MSPPFRYGALSCLVAGLALAAAQSARPQQDDGNNPELYRLRIVNQAGGPIQVSLNSGENWDTIGRVVQPASAVRSDTTLYEDCPAGSVVGVEAHTLTIRAPSLEEAPRLLSLVAAGARAAPGLLVTDVPAGGPLFRCLAPPGGSQVFTQKNGLLTPLPVDYRPRPGDNLVIVVMRATAYPAAIVIENKAEGAVTLFQSDGMTRLIGRVRQPLRGVGRYPGTDRAGSGAVVGWHPLTVMVATAGRLRRVGADGNLLEGRGGFVIQPAEPMLRGATHAASQLLIEAAAEEGEVRPPRSPLFSLAMPVSSGVPIDPAPTRVEVRIDGSDWEPMPDLRGPISADEFIGRLAGPLGEGRKVETGITHLRILCGATSPSLIRHAVRLVTTPMPADAVQRGQVEIKATIAGEGIAIVGFYLNGDLRSLVNQPPFVWQWDTTTCPNGEHLLELRGYNDQNVLLSSGKMRVLVDN